MVAGNHDYFYSRISALGDSILDFRSHWVNKAYDSNENEVALNVLSGMDGSLR